MSKRRHSWCRAGLLAAATLVSSSAWAAATDPAPPAPQATEAKPAKAKKKIDLEARKRELAKRREKRRRYQRGRRARQTARAEERRKKMLESAASLRERAAQMREDVNQGKLPPSSARPGAAQPSKESLLAQAARLEKRAEMLEARAKNPTEDGPSTVAGPKAKANRQVNRNRTRSARQKYLKSRWGATLKHPEVLGEMKQHSHRVAKLKRIRMLAQKEKKDELAKRATDLLAQERRRHDARMKQLQESSKVNSSQPKESVQ